MHYTIAPVSPMHYCYTIATGFAFVPSYYVKFESKLKIYFIFIHCIVRNVSFGRCTILLPCTIAMHYTVTMHYCYTIAIGFAYYFIFVQCRM